MAQNHISTSTVKVNGVIDPVATKLKRRNDKLALAESKRSEANTPGYRELNTISSTHTGYVNGQLKTISGTTSPTVGHPWDI